MNISIRYFQGGVCGLAVLIGLLVDSSFAEKATSHIAFILDENEYKTECTLPAFAERELAPRGFTFTFIHGDVAMPNYFPGIESLHDADLLVLSVRRRSLPEAQLNVVRSYLDAGKPLLALRTASHAFDVLEEAKPGSSEWEEFDAQVLGGNYHGHHPTGQAAQIVLADPPIDHPILDGISRSFPWTTQGALYKTSPLKHGTQVLLVGSVDDHLKEPVAWVNSYRDSRVFYTSLAHPNDFAAEEFNRMLVNAVYWCLGSTPTTNGN